MFQNTFILFYFILLILVLKRNGDVAADTELLVLSRGENGQLRVGVRRASKQQPQAHSTYFSSTNLHLGVLAAASHASREGMRFSVIYNPRFFEWRGVSDVD